MTHDGDGEGENGCVDDAGLMRPNGGSGYDWSSCNKAELEQFIRYVNIEDLAHISLESILCVIGKHRRPRSDTA